MIEEVEVGKLKEIDAKTIRYKYHKSGNPIEEAEMIRDLLDQDFSQTEIAKLLEISQPQIHRRLQLLKLHPTLQERLKSGDLRPTAAYDLSKLPMEVQEQYLSREKVLVKDVKATRREIIITEDLKELLETPMEKSVETAEKLELHLPPYGRSTELLRKFTQNGFHGEIVVTLNYQGEIHLTVYSLNRDDKGKLDEVTYRVI